MHLFIHVLFTKLKKLRNRNCTNPIYYDTLQISYAKKSNIKDLNLVLDHLVFKIKILTKLRFNPSFTEENNAMQAYQIYT